MKRGKTARTDSAEYILGQLHRRWGLLIRTRQGRGLGVLLLLCGLIWVVYWSRARSALRLEQHVRRTYALGFAAAGAPVSLPDGRMFLVTQQSQLLAMDAEGKLAWNKQLPGMVSARPVLVSDSLVVVVGSGALHGFSLGGEPLFSTSAAVLPGDQLCADAQGHWFILDAEGALLGLDEHGRKRFRTSLGLVKNRHLLMLPSGSILGAGTRADGAHQIFWAEPTGLVGLRAILPGVPAGLALSGRRGEYAAVATGSEIWTWADGGLPDEVARRLTLPGDAVSGPLLHEDGGTYALVAQPAGVALCRIDDQSRVSFCLETGFTTAAIGPERAPVLGRSGLVYAPFVARASLLPQYGGVMAVSAAGLRYRQELAVPPEQLSLTLQWSGLATLAAAGETMLWQLDGSSATDSHEYNAWPQRDGNPAGSLRRWQSAGVTN